MSAQPPKPAAPLTDSPWFWLCLFGCAALVGLTVIGPKWARRGQRLEFQRQGREHAFRERATGQPTAAALEDAEAATTTSTDLPPPIAPAIWPLMLVIGGALLIGGVVVFVRRVRGRRGIPAEDSPP